MKKSRKLSSARGWLACSLCLLLGISLLVQPLISSASERSLTPGLSSTQQPNAEGRKVTPLAPERGTPTGLNLPNLDEVRYRQRKEIKAPPAIESTMRSRRKAQKPQQKQKSHHAISRRQFSANLSSATNLVAPQSNPPSFTDDPLKDPNNPDSFKIKAVHLTELRYWINLLRNRRGLGGYAWVKPAASGGALNSSVLISWEPIDEMRTALNQAIGPPANGYAQGLGLNQWILAAHIQELRDRVKSEWGSSLADQLVPARTDLFNQSGNQIEARDCEWGIPLVSLPGRAGLDLGISLSYSSMAWSTAGSSISFDDDRGDPSPGFKIGFPTIQGRYIDNQVGTNVYLLITAAGRRVELRRVGSSNIYEAGDSSYLQLIENGNSLLLHTTDGTQMSYARTGSDWHCTSIEDRNGNLISATYNGDDLATVTDTLSRVCYFNYDANGNLTSISQNWGGSWRDLATFGWGTRTLHPAFSGYTVVGAYDGEVIPVLTQVGLMDGSHYNFEYSDRGQVNMIRHYAADGAPGPAGDLQLSYMAYNYESPAGDCPRISAARLWATNWNIVNGAPAEVPTYFADNHDGTHQMTTPDGTVYKELYGGPGDSPAWQHGLVTSSQVITGPTVQKTTTVSWTQDNQGVGYQTNPRMIAVDISDGTNHRRTTIDYGDASLGYVQWGLPYVVREYGVVGTTATELRRTQTDYNLSQPYLNQRIIGLVSTQQLYDSVLNQWSAKTTYAYDSTAIESQAFNAIQHDTTYDQNYNSSLHKRGNVTAVSRWDVNTNSALTSNVTYNAAGSVTSSTDAASHTSYIFYQDSFSDGDNSRGTFAYATKVRDADGFESTVQYTYEYGAKTRIQTPLPNVTTNQPGPVQTFEYDDALRLKQVTTLTNGAYVHYDYGPDYTSSFSSVNTVGANYWQSDSYTNSLFDGLGRVFAVASNHPGSSGGNKGEYTRYDQMGRAVQQTNPFEMDSGWNPTGDDVAGYQFNVANTFDWKGRPLRSYNMDGTYKEASYAGCGCAGGEVTTLTDEGTMDGTAAKRRQQKIYADVLGRTIKTELRNWEGGSVYATTVNTYNARDQVTLVRQYQGDESSTSYQDTTVSYDGYGRVKTKHAPEQEVDPNNSASTDHTTWTYNVDDTIASITDARGATQTFSYSNNNRQLLSGITYTAPSGIPIPAPVSFGYDAAGNRKSMTDGFGTVEYEYNALSALTSETRTFSDAVNSSINNVTKRIEYDYNLAGELKSIKDPSNSVVNYAHDNAGRLLSVASSSYTGFTQFASGFQYRAWGGLKHLGYGNNETLDQQFDGRMRLTRYALASPNSGESFVNRAQNYQYYDDNRVKFMGDEVDNRFDRAYGYDQVGRLNLAVTGGEARGEQVQGPYKETFQYDVWGNTTGRYTRQWNYSYGYLGSRVNGQFIPSGTTTFQNNRSSTYYGYDADGRVLVSYIGVTAANRIYYQYDARGLKVEARLGTGSTSVIAQDYDGDGQGVKRAETKTENSVTTTNVSYEVRSSVLRGQTIQEFSTSGANPIQYVYTTGGVELARGNAQTTMVFKHVDPVTRTEQLTWNNGQNNGRTELDPLGGDVGLQPPEVEEPDNDLPYKRGRLSQPADGCSDDGMAWDCNSVMLERDRVFAPTGINVVDLPGFGTNWGNMVEWGLAQYESNLAYNHGHNGINPRAREGHPRGTDPTYWGEPQNSDDWRNNDPDSIENSTPNCNIKVAFIGSSGFFDIQNGPGIRSEKVNGDGGHGLGFTVSGSVTRGEIGRVETPSGTEMVNPQGSWTIQQYVANSTRQTFEETGDHVFYRGSGTEPDGPSAPLRTINGNKFSYVDFPGPSKNYGKGLGEITSYQGEWDFAVKVIDGKRECEVKFHISMALNKGNWTAHWGSR